PGRPRRSAGSRRDAVALGRRGSRSRGGSQAPNLRGPFGRGSGASPVHISRQRVPPMGVCSSLAARPAPRGTGFFLNLGFFLRHFPRHSRTYPREDEKGSRTMNANRNPAKAIFLEAVEKYAPDEWPVFLDRACAGRPELRCRVEELLQAHYEVCT